MSTSIEDRIKETQKFVTELWGICDPSWIVEINFLQYRPTQENPDDKRMSAMFFTVEQVLTDWPQIFAMLEKRNRTQIENLHHATNPRFRKPRKHGKNSDVSHYASAWVDVDFHGNEKFIRKQFYEMIESLKKQGLGPSVIIESGHGLHAYWFYKVPIPVAVARPICAGLQDSFKISDAVHDPRRVLRLPGFLNLKDPKNPKWCKVVEATWERFDPEVFKDLVIEPSAGEEEREDAEAKKGAVRTVSRDPRIEEIKNTGVSEGEGPYGGRHNAAVSLAGHYAAKGLPKASILYTMREWNTNKNNPPLDDEELEKIIKDIWVKEQVRRAEEGAPKKDKEKSAKNKAKEKRAQSPWFTEDGDFNAPLMAQWFTRERHFMATPIADDGEGVTLYMYDNGVFRPDGASFVRKEAHRLLGTLSSRERLKEVVGMLTEYVKCEYNEVNQKATELINVKNGMLEWRTGTLHPHSPDHKSLIQLTAEHDPDAKSEDLDKFYNQVFPEDCIPLVDEFTGYLMIPSTAFEKAFVAIGSGGNGKGTFLKIQSHFLGEDNISTLSLHQIQEDQYATAGLFGKLANIGHDLGAHVLKSTGKFKSLVSGDPLSAERKYKDHYSFKPFCRLVFSANDFPRSTDRTEAYFSRLIFVEFPNTFRGTDKQIIDYDQVLIKKPKFMSAFLNRAIAGLQRLMKQQKFSSSVTSEKAIAEYKRECSSGFDFMEEYCRKADQGLMLSRKDLYERYDGICSEQGMKPVSARNFAKIVRDWGITEHKREGKRMWAGIAWIDGVGPLTTRREISLFGSSGVPTSGSTKASDTPEKGKTGFPEPTF